MTETNNIMLDGETILTFNFKASGRSEKRKLADLPIETIYTLLQYGTRKGNDSVNSAFNTEGNEKTRDELVDDFMQKVDSGDFNPARDTTETAFKDYIANVLKANGATTKNLKGLKADDMINLIALRTNKTDEEVEGALRKQFVAMQAATKAALEALK